MSRRGEGTGGTIVAVVAVVDGAVIVMRIGLDVMQVPAKRMPEVRRIANMGDERFPAATHEQTNLWLTKPSVRSAARNRLRSGVARRARSRGVNPRVAEVVAHVMVAGADAGDAVVGVAAVIVDLGMNPATKNCPRRRLVRLGAEMRLSGQSGPTKPNPRLWMTCMPSISMEINFRRRTMSSQLPILIFL